MRILQDAGNAGNVPGRASIMRAVRIATERACSHWRTHDICNGDYLLYGMYRTAQSESRGRVHRRMVASGKCTVRHYTYDKIQPPPGDKLLSQQPPFDVTWHGRVGR